MGWWNKIINIIFNPRPILVPTPIPPSIPTQLLTLHNQQRQKAGVPPLKLDTRLCTAAQNHSNWMKTNNTLSHNEGSVDFGTRLRNAGYFWIMAGENIAEGYPTPAAVMNGWMASSGHRANILNPHYSDVGFGYTGGFWTADFGTQASQFGSIAYFTPPGIKEQKNEED